MKSIYGKECKEIAWRRNYKAGYVLQKEFVKQSPWDTGFWLVVAYTPDNDYIGYSKYAYRLCVKEGIKPELADRRKKICSIGYCKRRKKWAGWSHRAICYFGIGDKLFDQNWVPRGVSKKRDEYGFLIAVEKMPFTKRGGKTIKNMKQAKLAAIRFADYVS